MKQLTFLIAAAALSGPSSAQWSTDQLSQERYLLTASSVGSTALFAGGFRQPGGVSDVVDLYDANTGTWSTQALSGPSYDPVSVSTGRVALFIGSPPNPVVDIYEGSTGTWSTTLFPNPHPPIRPAVASVGDKVYFGGGQNPHNAGYTDRVEIYDTVAGTWSLDQLSLDRSFLAGTSVGDLVLFAGGNYTGPTVGIVDILDTQTSTWSTSSLSQPRLGLVATSVGGKALFAGGTTATGLFSATDRVDLYDGATGTWSQAALSQARSEIRATAVGPYALFAGGRFMVGQSIQISNRVDIYDSRTNTWSTASLSVPRDNMGATAVDGLALFGGGWDGFPPYGYSRRVDIFDSQLGTMYCAPGVPNSAGLSGILSARGSLSVSTNDLALFAEQLPPGQFGYFLTGRTQGFIQPPASQGPICLSGNIGRYSRASEIIQGPIGMLQLDLANMPVNPHAAVLPGDTWNFQCWYRDVNPGSTSNTTNGLALTFRTTGFPAVQFPMSTRSLLEDATLLEVRITLSQPVSHDVPVSYTTGGTATVDVDWRVEEPNPFVIPAGETQADMTLVVAEDMDQESTETATVTLTGVTGGVLGTQTTFTLTILDDD